MVMEANMHNFVDSDKLRQPPEMPVKHLDCFACLHALQLFSRSIGPEPLINGSV